MNAQGRQGRDEDVDLAGFGSQTRWPPALAALATVAVLAGAVATASAIAAIITAAQPAGVAPGPQGGPMSAVDGLVWLTAFQAAVVAQVLLLARAFGGLPRHVLSLMSPGSGFGVVGPAVAALGAFATVYAVFVFVTDRDALLRDLSQAAALARSDAWLLALAAIGVGAPLSEELLFRGFLFPALVKSRLGEFRLGLAGAALVSTLAWTSLHAGYSLWGLVEVLCVGLYFSWLAVRTGSLWVPILCHAIYNTAIMLGLRWLPITL